MTLGEDDHAMFDPWSGAEWSHAGGGNNADVVNNDWPVVPVPEGAPEPDWERLKPPVLQDTREGPPIISTYHTQDGAVAFNVTRWEIRTGGKEIRPGTRNGESWALKTMPGFRSLYGLSVILESGDKPIALVDGETSADAAARMFPGRAEPYLQIIGVTRPTCSMDGIEHKAENSALTCLFPVWEPCHA